MTRTQLAHEIFSKQSYLCVGLDTDPSILPAHLRSFEDPVFEFNKRIIDATANRMGLPSEKVMLNIEKYGNTTAATIPLCLWEWKHELNKGDKIVLAAYGGGFTWGATLVKWEY